MTLVPTTLVYICAACKLVLPRDSWLHPDWFVARLRPCPKCGTALAITQEMNDGCDA